MNGQVNKSLHWAPRILAILFLCFLALFSLDVVSPEYSMREIAIGLFMHNIPVLVLAAILAISWKYEIVGGIGFIVAGILYAALILSRNTFEWYMLSWILVISGPVFLIGILFIINYIKNKI